MLCTGAPGILERLDDPRSLISYTDLAGPAAPARSRAASRTACCRRRSAIEDGDPRRRASRARHFVQGAGQPARGGVHERRHRHAGRRRTSRRCRRRSRARRLMTPALGQGRAARRAGAALHGGRGPRARQSARAPTTCAPRSRTRRCCTLQGLLAADGLAAIRDGLTRDRRGACARRVARARSSTRTARPRSRTCSSQTHRRGRRAPARSAARATTRCSRRCACICATRSTSWRRQPTAVADGARRARRARRATIALPGYTHMQQAMPSTVALWAGGFAAEMRDDAEGLRQCAATHRQESARLGRRLRHAEPADRSRAHARGARLRRDPRAGDGRAALARQGRSAACCSRSRC